MKRCFVLLLMLIFLVLSSIVGATDSKLEGGECMDNKKITAIPEEYKKAVPVAQRGKIREYYYLAGNYINSARQLVTNQAISSEEAGREVVEGKPIAKRFNIYLPAGYDENDKDKKYNVLYLLHGVEGSRNEWLHGGGWVDGNYLICNILDNLILKGEIEPLLVVFPEGRSAHDWADNSFSVDKTNILGFYYFDYELRYDLIPFIESNFNTYANIEDKSPEAIEYNRKHRAIAGLSMGGMQALNLTFAGYRHDSTKYTKTSSFFNNGLDMTIKTPGMQDLFAYVGAFSNAPTSSSGDVLGSGIASADYPIELLYITCGDNDGIAIMSYEMAIKGLLETAGEKLKNYYQVLLKGGAHDFAVWNNGAYNFLRLIFTEKDDQEREVVKLTLTEY